jgi:glycosyltransferase involved in cell wall biosynthesis
MRVMVAIEDRFIKTQNGNVYADLVDYAFLNRYLQVFSEVAVFARLSVVDQEQLDKPHANGPNVSFFPLPMYIGPWQYLIHCHKISVLAKQALAYADAFILRIPGTMATLLWKQLIKNRMPYGVEVRGDPWNVLSSRNVRSILGPILRRKWRSNMRKQCLLANAAAYVTEYILQEQYPPGGWSTHFSSIDLPVEAVVDEQRLSKRFLSLDDVVSGRRPFRICHAGTMDALYKAQDILIEAIAMCCNNGLRIELTLLGDGRYLQYFVDKAKQCKIYQNVKFLGMLPSGEPVLNQFDLADMFVLPSTTEGLPRVLIEAMAKGLPCIGTCVGGIPELLDQADMVAPGDAKMLAAKIESVIRNPARLEEMARRNLKTARKYCADELNQRRIEFYKKVMDETNARHTKQNKL